MDESHQISDDGNELIDRLIEGRLDATEFERVTELLRTDEEACLRYIEAMHLLVGLSDWAQDYETSLKTFVMESIHGRETAVPSAVSTAQKTRQPPDADVRSEHGFSKASTLWVVASDKRWMVPVAVGAGILILFLAFGRFRGRMDRELAGRQLDQASNAAGGTHSENDLSENDIIGRIVEISSHAIWSEDAKPTDFLMRLAAGERLELLRGLAEVELSSGVRLILHAHTSFTFAGPERGVLHSGTVTGIADKGNFTIVTASAEIVDLGTEFGVSVDAASNTKVVVFEGEVQVAGKGRSARNTLLLNQGGAAGVASDGTLDMRVDVRDVVFVRSLPKNPDSFLPPDSVSLVDIMSGGDGQGSRLSVALNPLTCQIDRRRWINDRLPGDTPSDRRFHRSDYHPMIDGTFIIPADGKNVQLDSAGQIAPDFAQNEGTSWGPIWARRRTRDMLLQTKGDFWGTGTLPFILDRIADAEDGAIGLHPNVGITFDLCAADAAHRGKFTSFRTVVVNLDCAIYPKSKKLFPERTADFWIFVDGKLRASRRNFGQDIQGQLVEVPLMPKDRFLTLVTTDGGNTNAYDHVLLIDPMLRLRAE